MSHNTEKKKFWIVAAGTGGHIFPGLSVAKELQKTDSNFEVKFFGTRDRLEEKIIPKHGYTLEYLSAKQWKGRGAFSRLYALWALAKATFQIWKLIPEEKPTALISVGGYVSMPLGLACWLRGVSIYLLEPNIKAGISNCVLSRFAKKAFTVKGSDASRKFYCPTFEFGNPVLGSFSLNPIREVAKNVLVLGGSQGARILCHVGLNVYARLIHRGLALNVFLQSGEKNLEDANELKKSLKLGEACTVSAFIQDMPEKLLWADVVIGRAGAMTLTELSLSGVPSVLVPYPHAADDHQRYNAQLWAQEGAVLVVDEKEKDFEKKLEDVLFSLIGDQNSLTKRKKLSEKIQLFARHDAAQKIVSEILTEL